MSKAASWWQWDYERRALVHRASHEEVCYIRQTEVTGSTSTWHLFEYRHESRVYPLLVEVKRAFIAAKDRPLGPCRIWRLDHDRSAALWRAQVNSLQAYPPFGLWRRVDYAATDALQTWPTMQALGPVAAELAVNGGWLNDGWQPRFYRRYYTPSAASLRVPGLIFPVDSHALFPLDAEPPGWRPKFGTYERMWDKAAGYARPGKVKTEWHLVSNHGDMIGSFCTFQSGAFAVSIQGPTNDEDCYEASLFEPNQVVYRPAVDRTRVTGLEGMPLQVEAPGFQGFWVAQPNIFVSGSGGPPGLDPYRLWRVCREIYQHAFLLTKGVGSSNPAAEPARFGECQFRGLVIDGVPVSERVCRQRDTLALGGAASDTEWSEVFDGGTPAQVSDHGGTASGWWAWDGHREALVHRRSGEEVRHLGETPPAETSGHRPWHLFEYRHETLVYPLLVEMRRVDMSSPGHRRGECRVWRLDHGRSAAVWRRQTNGDRGYPAFGVWRRVDYAAVDALQSWPDTRALGRSPEEVAVNGGWLNDAWRTDHYRRFHLYWSPDVRAAYRRTIPLESHIAWRIDARAPGWRLVFGVVENYWSTEWGKKWGWRSNLSPKPIWHLRSRSGATLALSHYSPDREYSKVGISFQSPSFCATVEFEQNDPGLCVRLFHPIHMLYFPYADTSSVTGVEGTDLLDKPRDPAVSAEPMVSSGQLYDLSDARMRLIFREIYAHALLLTAPPFGSSDPSASQPEGGRECEHRGVIADGNVAGIYRQRNGLALGLPADAEWAAVFDS